jgi:hypothetical protein
LHGTECEQLHQRGLAHAVISQDQRPLRGRS